MLFYLYVQNSGLLQGKLIRRGKIPKREDGSYWHWKDLQVGKDMAFYGTVYHTVDCDLFTRVNIHLFIFKYFNKEIFLFIIEKVSLVSSVPF